MSKQRILYIDFILTITICLLTAQWFENLLPWAFGTQKKK